MPFLMHLFLNSVSIVRQLLFGIFFHRFFAFVIINKTYILIVIIIHPVFFLLNCVDMVDKTVHKSTAHVFRYFFCG